MILTGYAIKPVYQFSPQIDLVVGGELGYFLSGNFEVCEDSDCEDEDIDSDDWDDADGNFFEYGLVIGGRYYINEKMSIVGTYYLGLPELTDDFLEASNRSFQIYISTLF